MDIKCIECGRELRQKDEGITWRECSICKKPVCLDHIHFIGVWRDGLYSKYVDVIPVCKNELPKMRREALIPEFQRVKL